MEWREERIAYMRKILILIIHRAIPQSPLFSPLTGFDEDTHIPSAALRQSIRCVMKIGLR